MGAGWQNVSALILRDATKEELEAAKDKDKDKDREGDDKAAAERKPKAQKPWVIDRLQFKADEIAISTAAAPTSTSST